MAYNSAHTFYAIFIYNEKDQLEYISILNRAVGYLTDYKNVYKDYFISYTKLALSTRINLNKISQYTFNHRFISIKEINNEYDKIKKIYIEPEYLENEIGKINQEYADSCAIGDGYHFAKEYKDMI